MVYVFSLLLTIKKLWAFFYKTSLIPVFGRVRYRLTHRSRTCNLQEIRILTFIDIHDSAGLPFEICGTKATTLNQENRHKNFSAHKSLESQKLPKTARRVDYSKLHEFSLITLRRFSSKMSSEANVDEFCDITGWFLPDLFLYVKCPSMI